MEPISEPLLTGEAFYTFMLASPYAPPRLPHSERATRFTTAGCARLLERAAEIKVHPHMLRHACGFKLANDGKDTRSLQAYNAPIIATRHPLAHPGFPDAAYSNGGRDHQQILCAPESAREFLQAELRKMRIESMSRESGLAACADAKNDAHSLCTVSTDDQSVDAQVKELGVQTLPGPATAILACAETFTPPASAAIDKALLQFCSFIVCDGNAR